MKDSLNKEIKLDEVVKIHFLDHYIFEKEQSLEKFLKGEYAVTVTGQFKGENDQAIIIVTWDGIMNFDQFISQYDGYVILKSTIKTIEKINSFIQ